MADQSFPRPGPDIASRDDVAHLRDTIDQLTRRVKASEAANGAKDELLARIGHDLRNPMNAIATSVEVLTRVDRDSPIAASACAVIARQTRKLARMTDELLDIGQLLSADATLFLQPLQLADIVRRCVDQARPFALARDQALHATLADCSVHGDSRRVAQAVDHLLDNACKHSPSGTTIVIHVGREVDHAVLRVTDAGEHADRRTGLAGIGLAFVHRVAELHGGSAGAGCREPVDGLTGSVFELRLPAIEAAASP